MPAIIIAQTVDCCGGCRQPVRFGCNGGSCDDQPVYTGIRCGEGSIDIYNANEAQKVIAHANKMSSRSR